MSSAKKTYSLLVLPLACSTLWQPTSETEEKGFSLLEVIIALAILAVGLVTLLELFAGSLRLTGKATQRTLAVIHAQNVMDSVFAQEFLEDGEDGGELSDGYFWRMNVQEIFLDEEGEGSEAASPANRHTDFHLKEIEVRIGWEEGERQRSFILRSMRALLDDPTNTLKETDQ